MSIVSQTYGLVGQDGVAPRRIQLIVTDDLAVLTEPGYLNENALVPNTVYATDIVDCFYLYNKMTQTGNYGQFFVTIEQNGVIVLSLAQPGGNIAWTPTITFAVPGDLSVVYNLQIANFASSGNIGLVGFVVDFVPTYTTSSGSLEILGFPIVPQIVGAYGAGLMQEPSFPTSTTSIAMNIKNSPGIITIGASGSSTTLKEFATTEFASGSTYNIQGTIPYFI